MTLPPRGPSMRAVVTGSRELEVRGESRAGGVRPLPWLLLAGAAILFAVRLLTFAGPGLQFPPEPPAVLFALRSAAPFALAAAVIIGAGNWPGGRRWFLLGAGALALHGALDLVGEGMTYWVLADPSETPARATSMEWISYPRAFLTIAAAAAAPLLLGVGLWRGAEAPARLTRWRWVLVALAVAVGLLALVAGSWLAVEIRRRAPGVGLAGTWEVLMGLEAAAMALLSVPAIRSIGGRAPLPEALIGAGALLAGAALAALLWDTVASVSSAQTPSSAAPYLLGTAVNVLGLLLVGLGFASGRLVPPAGAPADAA